jgi:acetyltransferase-like isoleucine patch superfamily enzyme
MLIKNNKPLMAISYDTQTFRLLCQYIYEETGIVLGRILPSEFLINRSNEYQYINLVIKDFDERKQVSAALDQYLLDRFTYIDQSRESFQSVSSAIISDSFKIGQGCFIYPAVFGYSGTFGNDVIVHSFVKLAENVSIGNGTFISGSVTIAGSCRIGEWNFIGNNVFIIDNVVTSDNVRLLPGLGVRKNIKSPGTYYNPYVFECKKIE